ncbi:hypothetical protein Y032_0623g768 [Ancylostoma ceylanicum]|uniref:Secreted protein n=1 Tax=Ancylostoma ceylanicum TaxID=53326 RepID=A0A016WKW2_9BILA|nr:hypothetical protein Y032_0623g768 [Ancylostoma ceylanicum]
MMTFLWRLAHGLLFARVMLRLVFKTQIIRVENKGDDSSKSTPKSHLVYYRLSLPAERMNKRPNLTSVRN